MLLVIYCYHGDGSVYVQSITAIRTTISAATLKTVLYGLTLFVVGGERIAMVMVVVGHICTQNIMVVHNIIY